MGIEFRLDLESGSSSGKGLDEPAAQGAITAECVLGVQAEESADDPGEGGVSQRVAGSIGALHIAGDPSPVHHVVAVSGHHPNHLRGGGRIVCVVPVHHDEQSASTSAKRRRIAKPLPLRGSSRTEAPAAAAMLDVASVDPPSATNTEQPGRQRWKSETTLSIVAASLWHGMTTATPER